MIRIGSEFRHIRPKVVECPAKRTGVTQSAERTDGPTAEVRHAIRSRYRPQFDRRVNRSRDHRLRKSLCKPLALAIDRVLLDLIHAGQHDRPGPL